MDDRLVILALGGTISMTGWEGALRPGRSAADLLAGQEAVGSGLVSAVRDLCQVASASLDFADVVRIVQAIAEAEADGASGIVVTQGTDTMEEVAFAVDLLSDARIPVIFTGAMRAPCQPGHDGARNLADVICAGRHLRGRAGVFIAMDGQVHLARFAAKSHTLAVGAFLSTRGGPVCSVHEGRVYEHGVSGAPRVHIPLPEPPTQWPQVALLAIGLAEEGRMVDFLAPSGYAGCVLAAAGGGHVPAGLSARIGALVEEMPVILSSRVPAGPVYQQTYDYPGSERDLIGRGVLPCFWLGALQARILLTLCLAARPETAREDFLRRAALLSGLSV